MACCQKWRPVFVILAVYFAMALLNIFFKKVLNEGENQLVIVTYRLASSAVFLTPIAFFWERKQGSKLTISIVCLLFVSALLGATLTQYFYLLGLQHTSAALATAFINITPVLTFLMATICGVEELNLKSKGGKAKILGSLICIGGVILLTVYRGTPLSKEPHTKEPHTSMVAKGNSMKRWILGSIFLILSDLFWSSWFLIQDRIGKKYPCKYSSTAFMSFFGALQSVVLCLAINRDTSIWVLRGKFQILTVLFAGIAGSGLCYVGMSWCVEKKGPVFTAAFSPFIQIFVAILDLAFLHEQIYLGSVVGSILVISGLYVLLWGKNQEAEENAM